MDIKKIINPWTGVEGYNCIGCSPDNPIGLHLCFWLSGNLVGISINLCKSIQKELFINDTS